MLAPHDVVGVATTGVVFAAGPLGAALDTCGGHVHLSTKQYHYHGDPTCLLEAAGVAGAGADAIVGWALDGFAIHAPFRSDGSQISAADLDRCHGHEVDGVYRYVAAPRGPFVGDETSLVPLRVPDETVRHHQ